MIDYTNSMGNTDNHIDLNASSWWKAPSSHPFSTERPVIALLTDTRPCEVVTMLRTRAQLTGLKLHVCENVTDTGMEHLAQLTQLASLGVGGCNKITVTERALVHC